MAGKQKAKDQRVPVTMDALLQRINRKLKPEGEALKTTKGQRAIMDLGYYYVLEWSRNIPTATHVDPETLGRELGVLKPFERVVEEGEA